MARKQSVILTPAERGRRQHRQGRREERQGQTDLWSTRPARRWTERVHEGRQSQDKDIAAAQKALTTSAEAELLKLDPPPAPRPSRPQWASNR